MNAQTAAPAHSDAAMIADLKALPKIPVIFSSSVLAAQGWTPEPEARAAISAHLAWARTYGFPVRVDVRIMDRPEGALLGHLTFTR